MLLLINGGVLQFFSGEEFEGTIAHALVYWIIDLKNNKNRAKFGVIVGMNPIFIYLFESTIRGVTFRFAGPWANLFFNRISENFTQFFMLSLAWFINWYVCYLLYKRKIFIRI
jgi:hypothetical protein